MKSQSQNQPKRINTREKVFFLIWAFLIGMSTPLFAANLGIEAQTIENTIKTFDVVVKLDLNAGESVSAFDFELNYDKTKLVFNNITADLNLQASGKNVAFNETTPGTVKGLIYGVNSTAIAAGKILSVSFTKQDGASDGEVTIALSNVHATDATTNAITVTVSNGTIFLNQAVVLTPDAPTILNTAEITNKKQMTLQWTDEAKNGAVSYQVSRLALTDKIGPAMVPSGLVAYWPLNEASGDAVDQQGVYGLTDNKGVGKSTDKPFGIVSGSRSFTASSAQSFSRAQKMQDGLDFIDAFTWAGWIKPSSLYEDRTILSKWSATGNARSHYRFTVTKNGELEGAFSEDGISQKVIRTDAGVIQTNRWQHVAYTVQPGDPTKPFVDDMKKHTVTQEGSVSFSTTVKKAGLGSAYFDGKNSALIVPDSAGDWDFGSGDFTVEVWVKHENFDIRQVYVSHYQDVKNRWILWHQKTKGITFSIDENDARLVTLIGGEMTDQNWHHVAVVRSGNLFTLYKDGVAIDSQSYSGTIPAFNGPLALGKQNAAHFFTGYLDELRVVKGKAMWQGNFTVPSTQYSPGSEAASTKLLMRMGNAQAMKLYVDGKEITSVKEEETALQTTVTSAEPFRVGAGISGQKNMEGLIADLAGWNRSLGSDEIKGLALGSREIFAATTPSRQEVSLTDGKYLYVVQSVNSKGTLSSYSLPYTVTIDTIAPAAPAFDSPTPLFNAYAMPVKGTVSEEVSSVDLVVSGGVISQKPVLAGNAWTASVTVTADGAYKLSAVTTDKAGNISSVTEHLVTIDTAAPVFTMSSPAAATYTVARKSVLFQGSVDDLSISSLVFRHTDSGGNTKDITIPVTAGSFSFNHTLLRGPNQCFLIATDAAGNQTSKAYSITYANNLPLEFTGLVNQSVNFDEAVSFTVNITNQNDIEPELLTFSASNLPGAGSSNVGTFDPVSRIFFWKPNQDQGGLYTVNFQVSDGVQIVGQSIKIVVQNINFDDSSLNDIVAAPRDHQAAVVDFDKDGFDDIYEVIHGANRLFRNHGNGTFEDVAAQAGVADANGKGNAVLAEDFNGDGWLDLYLINDGVNVLYINNKNGSFTDQTNAYGIGNAGIGKDAVFEDFDADGDKDLYILNDGENAYYRNDGNGKFTNVTTLSGLGDKGIAVNAIVGDFNADSKVDIFVINEGQTKLFLNSGANVFSDKTANLGATTTFTGYRGLLRDVDKDGALDIVLINHARDILFLNDGQAQFKEIVLAKAVNTAIAEKFALFIDYDNDGDMDVFVVDRNARFVDGLGNVFFHNEGNGVFTEMTAVANLI